MKESETKKCQNCNSKFTIEPEDFEFYKKIDVPEPTFCPECRMVRRLTFWNSIELYKRKCDFSGEEIISMYRPDTCHKIFHSKYWWSDKWDPMEYGKRYNFKKPFFEQFKILMSKVPKAHSFNINSINCDYCAGAYNSKNCYMSSCNTCENCFYSIAIESRDCFENFLITNCENCTNNILCDYCFKVQFAEYCKNCLNSSFLYDCRHCQDCFGCVNLKNKQYYIFNKKYSKKEYKKEISKYNSGNYKKLEEAKKLFEKFKLKFPKRFARIYHSHDVTGDNINNSKNCQNCFFILKGAENCKYLQSSGLDIKDSMDCFDVGTQATLCYEDTTAGGNSNRIFFSVKTGIGSYNIEYSNECYSSSNLFACVGLRHKQYCILNKQYTKEEYEKMIPRIKQHMNEMPYKDKKGRVYKYGEFFPAEFSPFDYNKSIAQENFPLDKESVVKRGYSWYDTPSAEKKSTMKASELPSRIQDADENITSEIIACSNLNCKGRKTYQIIPREFEYYKKNKLSLPRICFDCRYRERINKKNPMKLWERQCMCGGKKDTTKIYKNQSKHKHGDKPCLNKFQTAYSPDRKELIYCEECYQREVE